MNLKKTFLSFMAAGAILAGGFGGSASAADASTELSVTVSTNGTWGVQFCNGWMESIGPGNGAYANGSFGDISLNSTSQTAPALKAHVIVCYSDTLPQRAGFTSTLGANDFQIPNTSHVIPASNLTLGRIGVMNSGQWDGQTGPIGEISALTGSGNTTVNDHYGNTTWAGGNLSTSQQVHTGYAGIGTGGSKYETFVDPTTGNWFTYDQRSNNGSWQEMELLLTVPVNTAPGDYISTLTLTVTGGGQP